MSTKSAPSATTVTKRTFCRFCHAACPMEIDVDTATNQIVGIRGDAADPIYGAYTCIKGRHLDDQHHNPERLRTALKRQPDGTFVEMKTSDALDEIAERLMAIINEHGARSMASYCGTATFQNAAAHPVIRAFHKATNSPSFYTSITIDQPAKMITPIRLGSWAAGPPPWSTAEVSLVVGSNMLVSMFGYPGGPTFVNPLAALRDAKKRGLKLIVIDPRRTETAAMADIHLQVIPGEDPTLLAAMLKVILDENLTDREFCDRWVGGLEEFHAAVGEFDLEAASIRCGVPADDIAAAARLFAKGPNGASGQRVRGFAISGTGPNMAPHGTLMEHLVSCFNVVGGRYPREGESVQCPTGILSLNERPRAPKAQVNPPRPEMLTSGPKARIRNLHTIAGQAPTSALADEILKPGEGKVRALLTVGGNPVLAWPDQQTVIAALNDLDLHVALDIRVSATARLANYVIPSKLSLERPDVPTNVDRWYEDPYVMYTPTIIEPDPELVDEAGLYVELARRMGLDLELAGGTITPSDTPTPDDLLELSYPYARVAWSDLRASDGASIHEDLRMVVEPADADASGRFNLTPDGVIEELAEIRSSLSSFESLTGFDAKLFTHRMASRRLKSVFNSSGRELEALRKKETTSYAHMHPSELEALGVTDGDLVEITSTRSTVRVPIKGAPDVRVGTISMAHSWGDLPGDFGPGSQPHVLGDTTGRLTDADSAFDPITGLPLMSAIPVMIRAVSAIL
jgi:anaerobic selenocysteine-containing dehydrogenase